MFDVITIGSSTRDVFLKSEDFVVINDPSFEGGQAECLPLGSKIEIKDINFTIGGGATKTAITFARQGFKTSCIGVVGNDVNGNEVVNTLKNEGIDTTLFQIRNDKITAYSLILLHSSGERTILSYKGEGQNFEVDKIPFHQLEAKWLYIDSIGGHYDLFEALIKQATTANIKVACNPGAKEIKHGLEKLKPLLQHIDIYITNKEEGEEVLGAGDSPAEDVARKLKEYIPGIVSVSDGHRGVTAIDRSGVLYTAGVPDSPVVNRTGAGDAFGSGFVAEYIRSENVEKAIQFATANASSVVSQFAGVAGILKKDDWGSWPLVEVSKQATKEERSAQRQ